MEKKPLLTFSALELVQRVKGSRSGGPKLPDARTLDEQNTYVSKKVEDLEEYLAKQTAVLSDAPQGMPPEKILVIEAKPFNGSIKHKFVELLGVEWLLDTEFKDNSDQDAGDQKSYLYLSMTNQSALARLKAEWNRYYQNKGKMEYGFAVLRRLFEYIDDIRFWDARDRLRDTGLYERFSFSVKESDIDSIPVEIELWNRESEQLNIEASKRVVEKIIASEGEVYKECQIKEIAYNTILASLPTQLVESFYQDNNEDIELLAADEIMYFRPASQCLVGLDLEDLDEEPQPHREEYIREEPIIAIFDGFPLSNHEALKGKVIVDDPDKFEEQCPAEFRVHGTSMASCIINGDLSEEGQYSLGPVYLRPILLPRKVTDMGGQNVEEIPPHILPVDLIHRAVVRMFEGDGTESPAAPSVKIINLSIGDARHIFDSRVSPLARLIDWLSWKYDVLFVISTGNYAYRLNLGMTHDEFLSKNSDQKREIIVSAIKSTAEVKRLYSPAESINSLTVGSLHDDYSREDIPSRLIDPYERGDTPSPLNTASWGVKKSIKPDVLMPGGRQVYSSNAIIGTMPAILIPNLQPSVMAGIKTAYPSTSQSMNSYGFTTGSSNAAALATRKAAMIFETLEDLARQEELGPMQYSIALRALLVHSADISSLNLKYFKDNNKSIDKFHITRYSGYGKLEPNLSHSCFDNQATLIVNGIIKPEEGHKYIFPLPECLDGTDYDRRVIMTLAWKTPINANSHRYRGAKLFFKPPTQTDSGPLQLKSRELHHQQVKNGTIQHEVLSGDSGMWFDENDFLVVVNAMADGLDDKSLEIPYTLVVTLETPKEDLPIYEQVKTRLSVQERPRTKLRQ